VFEQIASGIILTNQEIITRVVDNKLEESEIKEICKEPKPLTHAFRSSELDVAACAKFLANRTKENIVTGNLNRSNINSTQETY
jgi:hypothetical protein